MSDKWICSHCQAINPALAFKCHNCPNSSGDEVWYTKEMKIMRERLSESLAQQAALKEQVRMLREELSDVADELKNLIDNLEHYYENKCIPTFDEIRQVHHAHKSAQKALDETKGFDG